VYFRIIIKKIAFLKKISRKVFRFQRKFFVEDNCYLLKEKSKLNNPFCKQSNWYFSVTCMYACTPTHIHTHKTFFYAVRKFYFDKKRRKIIIAQNRDPALRAVCAIAACNKQLPVRLTTTIAERPYLVARLY